MTSYVAKIAQTRNLPIVDAPRYTVITVTQDDVVQARKRSSKQCAIARAALRIPGVRGAHIFRTTAYLETANGLIRYKLPGSLQKEIVSFDRAGIFAPGAYHLAAVPPALTQEATRKRQASIRRKKNAAKRISRPPAPNPKRTGALVRATRTADLARNIDKIAKSDPANQTAEQAEFDKRVAEIAAPIVRPYTRARWVRGTEDA